MAMVVMVVMVMIVVRRSDSLLYLRVPAISISISIALSIGTSSIHSCYLLSVLRQKTWKVGNFGVKKVQTLGAIIRPSTGALVY
jgi:hypothetical protein